VEVGGSWKGKQGIQSAFDVLSRVAWELRRALDAYTLYMCSYSLHGGGVYTRTLLGPFFRLSLKCFLGSPGAL
jgi:hypothetical protein